MGCGTSRTTTVVPVSEDPAGGSGGIMSLHKVPELDPEGGPHTEFLTSANSSQKNNSRKEIAQPLAFEVPVDNDSLIKKHPPKRFQRLEDQQTTLPALSHEIIDEKQAEAQQRRLEILNQRVQSAKQRFPKKRFLESGEISPTDESIETMKRENSTLEL